MKTTLWKRKMVLTFIGILTLSFMAGTVAHADDDSAGLQGTWVVTVTQHDCTSGAQIGLPFLSLLTFARGGTMTETTSNPMVYPSERGPGHGVWRQISRHRYSASTIALITLNGALTTIQTITQTIKIGDDPDQFQTTKVQVDFFSPGGTLVRSGCATATGARYQ
ncbi:MAG TPA: hypothetical protein VGN39_01780 [Terriglobales bacterium]|jgi:hypothetical protein|nr:hypothetical protein [Terriglobales bacterium]